VTNAEADNLIATLPKPGGLQIYRDGQFITMAGGKHGTHSISVPASTGERLLIHWRGYVANSGHVLGTDFDASKFDPLAQLSQAARVIYRALYDSQTKSLARSSLAQKVRVGRLGRGKPKRYSWSEFSRALRELEDAGLVTSDADGRYTAHRHRVRP
jgi:DNA-binding transcriptional ArsR family regulator